MTTESPVRLWLKKKSLLKGTKEFDAAKKYLSGGNSIDTIKLKYDVSDER